MTALTYFLTASPSKFSRLKNEIRSRFSSEEEITMETTAPLKYLNACKSSNLVASGVLPWPQADIEIIKHNFPDRHGGRNI